MKKFNVLTQYQGTRTGFGKQTTVGFYTQKFRYSLFIGSAYRPTDE